MDVNPGSSSNASDSVWRQFQDGALPCICWERGELRPASERDVTRYVLPGSFNPIHDGHRGMAEWVLRQKGGAVEFELSLVNVEKGQLSLEMLAPRLRQFGLGERLWLTRAATFAEKSRLFPGTTFLVGADTIVRVADPRYHAGSEQVLRCAWQVIADQGCRFLVFGRKLGQEFQTLDDLRLPPEVRGLCESVPEQDYRADVSSSEIRRQGMRGEGV